MFIEKMTERARKAWYYALEAVKKFNLKEMSPSALLLGIIEEGSENKILDMLSEYPIRKEIVEDSEFSYGKIIRNYTIGGNMHAKLSSYTKIALEIADKNDRIEIPDLLLALAMVGERSMARNRITYQKLNDYISTRNEDTY